MKGKAGSHEIQWLTLPRGDEGSAHVQLGDGSKIEVRWRRDSQGLWLETPKGLSGYDIVSAKSEDEGVSYHLAERVGVRHWQSQKFAGAGEQAMEKLGGTAKRSVKIRAQMPGKIVRILIKAGDEVAKDQPILVMEAMKMENEIRAPQAGKIAQVKVSEGQPVESGADLAMME